MLRTKDFRVFYDKINLNTPTSFEMDISDIAFKLLNNIYDNNILYRSTGIFLENLKNNKEEQLFLFSNENIDMKKENLSKCFDKLENKFGKNIIKIGFS